MRPAEEEELLSILFLLVVASCKAECAKAIERQDQRYYLRTDQDIHENLHKIRQTVYAFYNILAVYLTSIQDQRQRATRIAWRVSLVACYVARLGLRACSLAGKRAVQ
jgi:hypothetical protein